MSDCSCCGGACTRAGAAIANRPGLPALRYRAGTHASFLAAMKARLSSSTYRALGDLKTRRADDPAIALLDAWALVGDVLTFYQERVANEGYLRTATERRSVLELARLVGYELRPGVAATTYLAYTLDEDRSVTPPRPSAVTIPAGSRAQSVPGQGEVPQPFETSEDLPARSSWNALQARQTRPQTRQSVMSKGLYLKGISTNLKVNDALLIDFGVGALTPFRVLDVAVDPPNQRTRVVLTPWATLRDALRSAGATVVLLKGISADLTGAEKTAAAAVVDDLEATLKEFAKIKPASRLALVGKTVTKLATTLDKVSKFESLIGPVSDVHTSFALAQEALTLDDSELDDTVAITTIPNPKTPLDVLPALEARPNVPPTHSTRLPRNVASMFAPNADALERLLVASRPSLADSLYPALKSIAVTSPVAIAVYRLAPTALFGANAGPQPLEFDRETGTITVRGEWPIIEDAVAANGAAASPRRVHEEESVVNLDGVFDNITPGTCLVIETADTPLTLAGVQVLKAGTVAAGIGRSKYGISGKTTRVRLAPADGATMPKWIHLVGENHQDNELDAVRRTTVYVQGEQLETLETPITSPIGKCDAGDPHAIELGDLYDGLESGRWLVVSGERVIGGTTGVRASELVMLAGVEHRVDPNVAGDRIHTFLTLAEAGLAYCYKRDTVVIYGNVVKATQGETRNEVLGSGDATKPLQQFTLRQPPLTFVPAANPRGVTSTLVVRVNDVEWHERESLADAVSIDRVFITRTDDDAKTTVIFGTGERGARPPTGQENIRAVYRNGIGKAGNVKADRVTLLATRPLGVKEVTNPVRASGGADRESRDQARQNAPLAVMALDRLLSTSDYADFARTFAGIGKAAAVRLSSGGQQVVHVTIAGVDDIPIDVESDLYRNLLKAERDLGDPQLPIQIAARELLALIVSANLRVQPDYEFESVAPKVRARLVETFGFERRDLGQPVFLSEVVAAIQGVAGVAWVDVDLLQGISEADLSSPETVAQGIQATASAPLPAPYVSAALARPVAQAGNRVGVKAVDGILPAQLAIFVADVPDTIILNEVPRER